MNLIQLNISGIAEGHSNNNAYALILNEVNGVRKLPIVIGAYEAQAIAIALEDHLKPSRPLTHDLFKDFINRFHINVTQVIIHKLSNGVFYSTIVCENFGNEEVFDARTSDAVAMAIRCNAPIFTYPNILDKAGIYLERYGEGEEEDSDEITDDTPAENNDINELVEKLEALSNMLKGENEEDSNPYSHFSVKELQEKLNDAVESENYREAAKLRDEIKSRTQE